jgi:hypothetical protein
MMHSTYNFKVDIAINVFITLFEFK